MTRRLLFFTMIGIACFLGVPVAFGQTSGPELGKITDLQVIPDGKRIIIKSQGSVGRYSAFVIKNPYRLVVDFQSTALAKVPGRIKVPGDRIREIRLGYANSRTRLVVDFGDRPVPAFKIERGNGTIQVALGNGTISSGGSEKPISARRSPDRAQVRPKPVQRPRTAAGNEGLVVKSAAVKDKLVVLELKDRADPRQSYRLVIDMDATAMLVRNATISDAKGNVKRFDLAVKESQSGSAPEQGAASIRGPRKRAEQDISGTGAKAKYKWGMPTVERKQPAEARSVESGPFRLERFRLEARKSGGES